MYRYIWKMISVGEKSRKETFEQLPVQQATEGKGGAAKPVMEKLKGEAEPNSCTTPAGKLRSYSQPITGDFI